METLTALTAEARGGGLDDAAALSSIAAVHLVAASFEHSGLALIEAAQAAKHRSLSGSASAMGASNRQTARKRHADLARRCPHLHRIRGRPPAARQAGPGGPP